MNASEFRYYDVFGEEVGKLLTEPLDPSLIEHITEADGYQKSYLKGHVVIAQLNRIFGYGGYSWVVTGRPAPIAPNSSADPNTGEIFRATGYTCTGSLTVRTKTGSVSFEGVGAEKLDGNTFDDHDRAIKGAETDAMKRAARHLGPQFGLSLYFGGATDMPAPFRTDSSEAPAQAAPASRQSENGGQPQSRTGAESQSRSGAESQKRSGAESQSRRDNPAQRTQESKNGGQTQPRTGAESQSRRDNPAQRTRESRNGDQTPDQKPVGGGEREPMPDLSKLSREVAEGLLFSYTMGRSPNMTEEEVRQLVLEHTGLPLAEVADSTLHSMIAGAYRKLRGL